MQTISFKNHNPVMGLQLNSENQFSGLRRARMKSRAIFAAVQEWESTLPGRAQDHIAQLVDEQWRKQNGRGINVNKQNLYRYLKNESGSEKYTSYVMQLSGAIVDAMPIEIARKHKLKRGLTESELVAEQWRKQNGRGINVNKQNLYRYLKNESGSDKYASYVMQLSGAIADAMPIEIARKHGLKRGLTESELVAQAIKECSEAHQAKLLGAPLQKLEREIREAAIALFNMLPADAAGPLLASISAVAPQFF